jgi:DNA (cytosine-5)-methyltransferase 1
MKKMNVIDLFAGCGGLLDGVLQSGHYNPIASVEWMKAPTETLRNRLKTRWGIEDADITTIRFDMQRIEELFSGFVNDPEYGSNPGLDKIVDGKIIDGIIGGPPCQAYSVAGRVSVKQTQEKPDYRNYLFEYYLKIVERYNPKFFVFENVPGMLSAMPDGTPITDLIRRDIENKGYEIIENIRDHAVIDISEFGVSQTRKRVILLGLNKEFFKDKDIQGILREFYGEILPSLKEDKVSVKQAIGDLPPCYPIKDVFKVGSRKSSHTIPETKLTWHYARFQNERDLDIFRMLAEDIESGEKKFTDVKTLTQLYNEKTGANTKVHKYHVLRRDEPSTTILAHLHKDGLRFIHYDSKQARSITVREAARLQSFDDDYEFIGSMGDAFKMIGNAVPPKFSKVLGNAVYKFMKKYER